MNTIVYNGKILVRNKQHQKFGLFFPTFYILTKLTAATLSLKTIQVALENCAELLKMDDCFKFLTWIVSTIFSTQKIIVKISSIWLFMIAKHGQLLQNFYKVQFMIVSTSSYFFLPILYVFLLDIGCHYSRNTGGPGRFTVLNE